MSWWSRNLITGTSTSRASFLDRQSRNPPTRKEKSKLLHRRFLAALAGNFTVRFLFVFFSSSSAAGIVGSLAKGGRRTDPLVRSGNTRRNGKKSAIRMFYISSLPDFLTDFVRLFYKKKRNKKSGYLSNARAFTKPVRKRPSWCRITTPTDWDVPLFSRISKINWAFYKEETTQDCFITAGGWLLLFPLLEGLVGWLIDWLECVESAGK